jgi:hypothetical protein
MDKEAINQKYLPVMQRIAVKARARHEEEAHMEADYLLIALLKDLELDEIATAFEKMPKWYA